MKRLLMLIALLACLLMVVAPLVPTVAAVNAPRIKAKDQTSSLNWSGYAVDTGVGGVTSVSGTWIVPTVTSTTTSYSSAWVGIDGDNSPTVEQIGTDQDFYNGKPQYFAWYEMYPKYPLTITSVPIKPGDKINATVTYGSRNSFTLTITDTSTGKSFSTTLKSNFAYRSSAEWIMEAPSSRSGVLPLADFDKVSFSSCQATINGASGVVTSPPAQAIDMVTSSGVLKAKTGNLSGGRFTVTWKASN